MTVSAYGLKRHWPWCGACRSRMEREYRAPQVVRETYGRARVLSHLHALEGDPYGNPPPFSTRSEEQSYRAEHQSRYGWGKE